MKHINKLLEIITSIMVVATIGVVSAGVFARYVLNAALTSSFELSTLLYAHIIFLGLSLALNDGTLIGVDLLTNALSPFWKKIFYIFSLCFMFLVACIMSYQGIKLFLATSAQLSALQISIRYLYVALPAGFAFFGLNLIVHIIRAIQSLRAGSEDLE